MEPEVHYTRTILFAAEMYIPARAWGQYFFNLITYSHRLFSAVMLATLNLLKAVDTTTL